MTTVMMNEIRINDCYAHLYRSEYSNTVKDDSIPKVNKKILTTNDYLKRISSNLQLNNTIVPPNCRYIEKGTKGSILVIEEPPAFRTIKVSMSLKHEVDKLKESGKLEEYGYKEKDYSSGYGPHTLTLALPYVIFLLYVNEYKEIAAGQTYLRAARLNGLGDYLFKNPMLNISDTQYICFGSAISGKTPTLSSAVEKAIMVFWSAEFNTDYTYNYHAYKHIAGVDTYLGWQALSKINPMFIYNVDWIDIGYNLGIAIEEMKKHYRVESKGNLYYKTLASVFVRPHDTGMSEKPTKRSRKRVELFYDVASGMFLKKDFFVHVGDPFMIKKGKVTAFIDSFIGFFDSDAIRYIRVETDKGRLIKFKLTRKFKRYLYEQVKKLRFSDEGTLKNGVDIKAGDILVIKNYRGDNIYKKVNHIRKSRDGMHEAKLGSEFYILENTEGEVMTLKNFKYGRMNIKLGDKLVYLKRILAGPIHNGSIVSLEGVEPDNYGNLALKFINQHPKFYGDAYLLNISSGRTMECLYKEEKIKELPPLVTVGRKLLIAKTESRTSIKNAVWGTPSGIVYEADRLLMNPPSISDMKKYILTKESLHVESFNLDTTFSIGDKVVVANWKNPMDILTVKMIQAFKMQSDNNSVSFILADKDGKLSEEEYISGKNATIQTGKIRKIENSYGRISAGTKIIAREAGIPYFPKKDTNIIVGFITDTGGEPLVLCSNCCTLWFSDMVEKFKKVGLKSKQWSKLQHASIATNIKYQAGDIIKGIEDYTSNSGWLVMKTSSRSSLKIVNLDSFSGYADYYVLDSYIRKCTILDCIPNPRLSPKMQTEAGYTLAWPNFHGLINKSRNSYMYLLKDERSLINV